MDNFVDVLSLTGFDNGSLSKTVHERDILNRENLRVIRRFGTKGGTRVDWEARLNGLLATNDVTPTQGFLVFAEGEVEKLIEFDVKPDTTPEIAEVRDSFHWNVQTNCCYQFDNFIIINDLIVVILSAM